jgi:hypothetical protein
VQNIADQLNEIQRSMTACERLFNLLDVKPEVLDKENAIKIEQFKGKIEFKHVWFAYEEENWILKDVSFVIKPRQTVAFVGATGAGKTTILSLIVRNYEVQNGEILIDDININDIELKSLRKAMTSSSNGRRTRTLCIPSTISGVPTTYCNSLKLSCISITAPPYLSVSKAAIYFKILTFASAGAIIDSFNHAFILCQQTVTRIGFRDCRYNLNNSGFADISFREVNRPTNNDIGEI